MSKYKALLAESEDGKVTSDALHKVTIEKLQQQLANLKIQESELATNHHHELEAVKSSLEAQSKASKQAASETEQKHARDLSDLQASLEDQTSQLNTHIQA